MLLKKRALKSVEATLSKESVETYLEFGDIVRISTPLPENIEILDRYQAGYNKMAMVTIYQDHDTDVYVYHIEEPPVAPIVQNLYRLVREKFQSMEIELPESLVEREVAYERYVEQALEELGYGDAYTKYPELRYYLIRDISGWGIIDVPMRDPRVEELDYSNPDSPLSVVVKHDKVSATWVDTNIVLSEEERVKLIEFIAFKSGKQISVAQPILEAKTPEGYRLAANLKEVGSTPSFTIRKFPERPLSLTFLVKNKTMSPLVAAYLWTLVERMRFILVIGGMATGKTTVLQAITSSIPRDKKVVTIEDTPELRLAHPRWQALYTRRAVYGTEQDVSLLDLARYSLRTRAQYIIIGEVRDREIQTLVQMAASGHGSLCLRGIEKVRVRINGAESSIPIRDLVEGILSGELRGVEVLSINLETMKPEWKPIVRVYKVPTTEWIVIRTRSGVTIHATPDHKFPLEDNRILDAGSLRIGDRLLLYDSGRIGSDEIVYIGRRRVEKEWSYDIEVGGNHTFLVNDRIISMNCTFHAEDPRTLFLRLTSPPLSVQPSFMLTISAIVLQQRVWSRLYGKFIRRTSKIWEITGLKENAKLGEIPVEYKEVITWSPSDDKHYPDTVEELVDRSHQLQIIAKSTYGEDNWRDWIIWELEEKVGFIEKLVEEGIFDFKEVTERIYRKTIEFRKISRKKK